MTLSTRLRLAADYMAEHGWTQGTEQDSAGHVCLTGAIRYCAPVDGDTYLIRAVLRQRGRAESWNDAGGRTEGEVLTLLRSFEVTDADLEATFGPQWQQIVGLVRRASTLNYDDGKQLAAAWNAVRDAVGDAVEDAVGDAAWNAARDAAWNAARDAVGDAARDAVGDAAWNAAKALVVRDLIGPHGFTQAHYDALTKAWRTIIGPIHPDDAVLSW